MELVSHAPIATAAGTTVRVVAAVTATTATTTATTATFTVTTVADDVVAVRFMLMVMLVSVGVGRAQIALFTARLFQLVQKKHWLVPVHTR